MDIRANISKWIVWILMIGLGVFTFATYMSGLKDAENYRENGGETIGTVSDVRNYTERERTGSRKHRRMVTKEYTDFTLEYTVDGENYTKFYSHMNGTYAEGETITVYYLNSDPGNTPRLYLEPSASANIIVSSVLVLIGVAGLTATIIKTKKSAQY